MFAGRKSGGVGGGWKVEGRRKRVEGRGWKVKCGRQGVGGTRYKVGGGWWEEWRGKTVEVEFRASRSYLNHRGGAEADGTPSTINAG